MIKDSESNKIFLADIPNGHSLIMGRSGVGKTYYICRKIEEHTSSRKKVLVLDFSASYTESELQRNQLQCMERVKIFNLADSRIQWHFRGKQLENILADSIQKILEIRGYHQKRLLLKGLTSLLEKQGGFSMKNLFNQLEQDFEKAEHSLLGENTGELDKFSRLLSHLEPYAEIENLEIGYAGECKPAISNITVIQLSDMPEAQRKFVAELVLEIFWAEARNGKKHADTLILDEFQNLKIIDGWAVSSILREGRKFGVSAVMSSQYFGDYNRNAINMLMQAGNTLFFRPTENEAKKIASMISPENRDVWHVILSNLCRGEFVLKGNYYIGTRKQICTTPIICRIQKEEGGAGHVK